VVRSLLNDGWIENASMMGTYFKNELINLQQKHAVIRDIRGLGLIIGVELVIEGAEIVTACMERGFLINCVQDRVLRFVPPLIIGKEEIDPLIACLDEVLEEIEK
jgi:4-aminobutyrate aminotransferase-like enzyme